MAKDADMGDCTDLLHSSSKLLEQAGPSAQLPLQRTLDQLEALSKELKAKTLRTEAPSQSFAATRLLAREGIDEEQLARDLKSSELKTPYEEVFPAEAASIKEYLLQVHEMAMLSAIQEAQKDNLRSFNDHMMKVLEIYFYLRTGYYNAALNFAQSSRASHQFAPRLSEWISSGGMVSANTASVASDECEKMLRMGDHGGGSAYDTKKLLLYAIISGSRRHIDRLLRDLPYLFNTTVDFLWIQLCAVRDSGGGRPLSVLTDATLRQKFLLEDARQCQDASLHDKSIEIHKGVDAFAMALDTVMKSDGESRTAGLIHKYSHEISLQKREHVLKQVAKLPFDGRIYSVADGRVVANGTIVGGQEQKIFSLKGGRCLATPGG